MERSKEIVHEATRQECALDRPGRFAGVDHLGTVAVGLGAALALVGAVFLLISRK